jgi:hypothetical protein
MEDPQEIVMHLSSAYMKWWRLKSWEKGFLWNRLLVDSDGEQKSLLDLRKNGKG